MPLSGIAPSRFHHQKRERDKEEEGDVNEGKCLFAPVLKENPPEPVPDKRAGIARSFSRADAQPVFPGGQRTDKTGQGLRQHHAHGRQVRDAEPQVAHERLPAKVTDPDQDEPQHDKRDKAEMNQQHQVGQH